MQRGLDNPMFGKEFSAESKEKLAYSHLKLNENQIIDIFNRIVNGEDIKILAIEFSVHWKTIQRIQNKVGIYGKIII